MRGRTPLVDDVDLEWSLPNILLFGQAGTGKDTVATMLEGFGLYSLALADPIREEFTKYFPNSDPKRNRIQMIEIAETYKRLYGDDVWCRLAHQCITDMHVIRAQSETGKIAHLTSGGRESQRRIHALAADSFLIRDGRYPIDYEYFVDKCGFTPVKMAANEEVRMDRLRRRDGNAQMDALRHEAANMIDADAPAYVLTNNGSLDDLFSQVLTMLGHLSGRLDLMLSLNMD